MPRTQYCDPSCLRESYVMRGLPAEVRHALVKVCVDAQPCTVFEQQQAMRTHRMLQFIPLPDQRRAQDYDRSLMRVTLHAGDATWRQGTAARRSLGVRLQRPSRRRRDAPGP